MEASKTKEKKQEAIIENDNLYKGEVFLVKDMIKGYVWDKIPRKNRMWIKND